MLCARPAITAHSAVDTAFKVTPVFTPHSNKFPDFIWCKIQAISLQDTWQQENLKMLYGWCPEDAIGQNRILILSFIRLVNRCHYFLNFSYLENYLRGNFSGFKCNFCVKVKHRGWRIILAVHRLPFESCTAYHHIIFTLSILFLFRFEERSQGKLSQIVDKRDIKARVLFFINRNFSADHLLIVRCAIFTSVREKKIVENHPALHSRQKSIMIICTE